MKILIVSQYYYPEPFLINQIAPELVKHGHKVTVLTGLPNYPEGRVLKPYRHGKNRYEVIDGVHVVRCFEIGRRKGKLFLILNYLSYSVSASFKVKKLAERFDIVLCYQLSPVFMALPAIVYKRKNSIPFLLYCLDIWPESAQAYIKNDKSLVYKWIAAYSRFLYQTCDKIVVTSEPFLEYFKLIHGIALEKLSYVPQHADDRFLGSDFSAEDNGIVDFMFAGNFGAGQTLDVIIKAAFVLKGKANFRIHFVGDGSQFNNLKAMVEERELEDIVQFHGRHQSSEMEFYYRLADALLITLRGNNYVGNTMPGKLQTYMTTGKPIFGAINGAAQQIIYQAECGACVKSGDYQGLAEIMLDYIHNTDKYRHCGENAKAYFKKNFTKKIFIERLKNELSNTINQFSKDR